MSAIKDLLDAPMNRRKSNCTCNLCEGHRMTREVVERGDIDELRKLVEDYSEMLCNTGAELEMANMYIAELLTAPPEGAKP